ncbi:MAG TPA: hypothetical protein VH475_06070 [Tepidisphaeraceae bacterium]
MKYLSIDEASGRDKVEDFFANVKEQVIPYLIERGVLSGRTENGTTLVADDAALARVMRLGIESFVYGQDGWSFMAVRAPIGAVSAALARRPGVKEHRPDVRPAAMSPDAGIEGGSDQRHTFLISMRQVPDWSVLVQTVHWFHNCDAVMTTALAAALSRELKTLAVAAWDDDFSGSSMIICENGERASPDGPAEEGEDDDAGGFYGFFYERGIHLPECFISAGGESQPTMHVREPGEVARADYFRLAVPAEVESPGPHALEKLAMMAEAIEEEIPDEEAFVRQMRGGIWNRAKALLDARTFC